MSVQTSATWVLGDDICSSELAPVEANYVRFIGLNHSDSPIPQHLEELISHLKSLKSATYLRSHYFRAAPYTAHLHAEVLGLHNNYHAKRAKVLVQRIRDLLSHPLLKLQPSAVAVDKADKL